MDDFVAETIRMPGTVESAVATARVALLTRPGGPLELRDVPVPPLGEREVLVRIDACAVCGSDLHTAHGRRPHPLPTILGHEIAGTVVAVGAGPNIVDVDGATITAGERITWSVCASCGECDRCRGGLPQKCRQLFKYGHAANDEHSLAGGFASHVVLRPGTAIVRLPAGLAAVAAASASCAVATAAAAIRINGDLRGRSVVVLGAGMLGLSVASLATARAAASVTVVDSRPERLDLLAAAAPQANTVPWSGDEAGLERLLTGVLVTDGADLVVDAGGSVATAQAALRLIATGGTCVLAGTVAPVGNATFDPERIVRRQATIRGVHNYRPEDLAAAVSHLASPAGAGLASLAGPVMPLDRIDEALVMAAAGTAVRVVVTP
ncbi:MAG: alcohol dehydrogenase catalytic domain-containing protein [Planctomycetota bacterium]